MNVKGPSHLWTGDWRTASRENDESLGEQAALRPPPDDPLAEPTTARIQTTEGDAAQRRSRLRGAPFAIGLIIAILAAGGLFASSLIGGGDDGKQTAKSP